MRMDYCNLCKREIHDWSTHVKSSEHIRNVKIFTEKPKMVLTK